MITYLYISSFFSKYLKINTKRHEYLSTNKSLNLYTNLLLDINIL